MDALYYMGQAYPNPPCWHLVSHVLAREAGYMPDDFTPTSADVTKISRAFRAALHNATAWATKIDAPEDYCMVLMGRTQKLGLHHAGIYYNGSVLHALPGSTLNQSLLSVKDEYKVIEYWKVKNDC